MRRSRLKEASQSINLSFNCYLYSIISLFHFFGRWNFTTRKPKMLAECGKSSLCSCWKRFWIQSTECLPTTKRRGPSGFPNSLSKKSPCIFLLVSRLWKEQLNRFQFLLFSRRFAVWFGHLQLHHHQPALPASPLQEIVGWICSPGRFGRSFSNSIAVIIPSDLMRLLQTFKGFISRFWVGVCIIYWNMKEKILKRFSAWISSCPAKFLAQSKQTNSNQMGPTFLLPRRTSISFKCNFS